MFRAFTIHFFKCSLALLTLYSNFQVNAGGVILYEVSSSNVRLASAGWSARADDASTAFTNPAGMSRFCAKQAQFGGGVIFSHFKFDPNEDTSVEGSDGHANLWLPSGSFYYIHPVNDRLTLGVASVGYFGADLVYNHEWVGRYYAQKVLLEALSFVPSASYKLNDQWSIGVGANIMYGFFKQRSAVRNILDGDDDGYFNCHAYRFGFGGVFGVLYEPSPCTRFGIQYLTPVKINFHARPKFHDIGPRLDDLLTVIGIADSSLNLNVKVPQSVMFSAYHEMNSRWAVMANVGWQQWSDFQEASITLANLNENAFTVKHKYEDSWHVALGVEWHWNCDLTLSGGVAYDSSAVKQSERTPSFPVGEQWRFGTGACWSMSKSLVVDFATELQWLGNMKMDVDKGAAVGRVSGTYRDCYVWYNNVSLTYLF